ncbi:hypothetical protein [Paractinoplanes toevensis]|uniref:hypothetical protein n=1 Tax=Paractinoplanes toevensis TaxID=571911 RepID=UPI001BB415F2|nr:hypothetical protein [Actinoplanes toevensis]
MQPVGADDLVTAGRTLALEGLQRTAIGPYRNLLTEILTADEIEDPDRFVPPVLPEPPNFQAALEQARRLVRAGEPAAAWRTVESGLLLTSKF